jgi:3-oxoacyl-[acyl-carrier-protein] synthase II
LDCYITKVTEQDPSKRIVVTGMGCISTLGPDVMTTWRRLAAGEEAIQDIRKTILADYPQIETKVAAPVESFDLLSKAVFADKYRQKDLKRIHRSAQFALWAGSEALVQAGLIKPEEGLGIDQARFDPDRFGIFIGTDIGGGEVLGTVRSEIDNAGRGTPAQFLEILPERVASVPTMAFNARGPSREITTACSTGNSNIIAAAEKLMLGKADVMLAGGSSGSITPVAISLFESTKATDKTDNPKQASRPFNKTAGGLVIGEGAGALVLETLERAKRRGAVVLAELVGYGETGDAYHDTAPSGEGAAKAMREAIIAARASQAIDENSLGYLNAHATGTRGDPVEMAAIAKVFTPDQIAGISSSKGAFGHTVGAAGAIESIISIMAMREGIIPPSLKLDDPIEETEGWNMSPNQATQVDRLDYAVNNSFGFGGLNAVTVYARPEED